jgi:hypothetical protein
VWVACGRFRAPIQVQDLITWSLHSFGFNLLSHIGSPDGHRMFLQRRALTRRSFETVAPSHKYMRWCGSTREWRSLAARYRRTSNINCIPAVPTLLQLTRLKQVAVHQLCVRLWGRWRAPRANKIGLRVAGPVITLAMSVLACIATLQKLSQKFSWPLFRCLRHSG